MIFSRTFLSVDRTVGSKSRRSYFTNNFGSKQIEKNIRMKYEVMMYEGRCLYYIVIKF